MTSVSNVQQIVSVIRDQLAARAGKPGGRTTAPAPPSPQGGKASALDLAGKRVRAIGKDDPERGRKALRIFLESVLLSELDEALINDPEFHRMVDEIQAQMEANPALASTIETAITQLGTPR